jgi:hypothetical protein
MVRIADRGVIIDTNQETVVNLLSTEFSSYAQGPVDKIGENHRMLWLGFRGQRTITVEGLREWSKPAQFCYRNASRDQNKRQSKTVRLEDHLPEPHRSPFHLQFA